MGTWGYRLHENDTFCEVVESFKEYIRMGISAEEAAAIIRQEYQSEVDACIASLAIIESLWRMNKLTQNDLIDATQIIDKGIDREYWMQLGADKEFIRNRQIELTDFLIRISRVPTERETWTIKNDECALRKGSCFWYRYQGNIYGAIVIEINRSSINHYLIALSEKLDSVPQSPAQVLIAPVYTVAWFGDVDLLPFKRMHIIGNLIVCRNYDNKYGINICSNQSISISNCGQSRTWAHSFRQISFSNVIMQEFVK